MCNHITKAGPNQSRAEQETDARVTEVANI